MIETGIKQVFLCMCLCKLEYIKMPCILQLRPRILTTTVPRFFLPFGRVFPGELPT